MAIKLSWSNANKPDRTLRIYKKVGPGITIANKGDPVATLPGNARVWLDEDTNLGQEYSYLISVSLGDDVTYSTPTSTVDLMRRGPGGFRVIQGDAALGYMGTVSSADLPDMPTHFKVTGYNTHYRTNQAWHKFVRKGKILFVLDSPLTNGYDAASLGINGSNLASIYGLSSGIKYGFDTSSADFAILNKINIVEHNGFRYHSRAARAFPDDWNGVYTDMTPTLNPETEFNQLIQPMIPGIVFRNSVGSRSPGKNTVLFRDFIAAESRGPTNKVHVVKTITQISSNRIPNWEAPCAVRSYTWDNYPEVSGQNNQHCFHIPVLELIEE